MEGKRRESGRRSEALLLIGGVALLAAAAARWGKAAAEQQRAMARRERVEEKKPETREVGVAEAEKEDVDLATQVLDYVVKNYAPNEVKKIWNTLTPEQKAMIAATIVAKAKEGIPAIQDALASLASRIGGAVAAAINWLKEKLWAILAALGIIAVAAAGGGWAGPVASAVGAMFYPL